jgi:hypothetical protein
VPARPPLLQLAPSEPKAWPCRCRKLSLSRSSSASSSQVGKDGDAESAVGPSEKDDSFTAKEVEGIYGVDYSK